MQMTDSAVATFEDEWVETDSYAETPKEKAVRARSANKRIDIEPVRYGCTCWRCSNWPMALNERGPLDRILALHLRRMDEKTREDWIAMWVSNPNHGPVGEQALRTWLAIVNGARLREPRYPNRGRA